MYSKTPLIVQAYEISHFQTRMDTGSTTTYQNSQRKDPKHKHMHVY